ncbi:MAG: adenylosuccinate lyase [Bdellovibrionales bacterium]|nr:adenylosuccinate lyase [Bdellovibrionales bacterium]
MIARYSLPEMTAVWTEKNRYLNWLKVEEAVCEELIQRGKIPAKDGAELMKALERLAQSGGVDPARVEEIEKTTRHDVIAFTTAVAEKLGPISRYVHYGLTSSDVVDTALSLNLQIAGKKLLARVDGLLEILGKRAKEFQNLPTIGRSHGIYAEPTAFGLKFLGWYTEWFRNRERLERAIDGLRVGKLSGAVGVNAHWGPDFEEAVLERLGLRREPVSTQVLPRDRHAEFQMVLGLCGSSMERIAVELRHLQRSEVAEAREGFRKGQKGSSAMPHKRNPISSENLTGCARLLRSYVSAAMENVALWHERDISHSSVERVTLSDSTILLDYALDRLTGVVRDLEVDSAAIEARVQEVGQTAFSGHFLLGLVEKGVTREDAYAWVQECALKSIDSGQSFLDLVQKHAQIGRHLSAQEMENLGSMDHQLRNVREIFQRVLP